MEIEKLLRRVHEMEVEVQKLKAALTSERRRPVQVVVKKSVGFVITYWTLLSFVVAVGIAVYIKYAFDVDYFENYRTVADSRRLSAFHTTLGNDLLMRQQWAAADDAFTRALAANANNQEASYGLLKSRVFKPAPGEKLSSPETQQTMLNFLRRERPDDPDLDLLQAWVHWSMSQADEARKYTEAAIAKRPRFSAALQMMSHMSMADGELPAAIDWCRKALEADPDSANAQSNMGFMLLLTGDYPGAIAILERANRASPNLLTPLVLSDACRLSGEFQKALHYSRNATRMAADENLRDTVVAGGEWLYNHLPLSKDDQTSWTEGVYVYSMKHKEALCQFAFALDLALTGDAAAAEKAWAKAMEAAPESECREYFVNKITATLALSPQSEFTGSRIWLMAKLRSLTPAETAPPSSE